MKIYRVLPALWAVLLGSMFLYGQDNTGRIVGTITDPHGLIIQNARIDVIHSATNVVRITMTDEEGKYQVLRLPIGSYIVKVEKTGFATAETMPVELQINQSLRFDIQMKLGVLSEVITVDASAPLIETIEPSLGSSVTGKMIVGMPLNGRNTMILVGLQAGATEQREGGPLDGAAFSISGGRTDSVTFLLDGMVNNSLLDNSQVLNPNPDMIQEFRVVTSNGSAEFGRNAGGIVSAVSKSGTESFHGSVYDYVRNENFNANRYFFKHGDAIKGRPILKRNQFGGTVNGPLVIPGVLENQKLFFSFGYQGQRQIRVVTESAVTAFTPEELHGDFSKSGENGAPDAGVAGFLLSHSYFQPDPELAAQAIIDPARIHSVALSYVTAGFIPSSSSGSISPSGRENDDRDEITAKIDYAPSVSDQIAVTFGYSRNPRIVPFSSNGNGSNVPGMPYADKTNVSLINATYIKIFSPVLLNEFRAGAQRDNRLNSRPIGNLPKPADLGFAITPDFPAGPPWLYFTSGLTVGAPIQGPSHLISNTFTVSDSLIRVYKNHTMKAGASLDAFQSNLRFNFIGNGAFFYGSLGKYSGNDRADFLLGLPEEFCQAPYASSNIRTKSYSAYIQDEWHVRNNFVFTFGLRYEYSSPKTDTKGRTFSIIPGKQSAVFSNAPQGILFPGDAGAPRGANFPDRNDFAPRFGFAWSPGGKTSIRGGFGVYYDILKAEDNLQFNGQVPFASAADIYFDSLEANPSSDPINFSAPYAAAGRPNPFPSKPPSKDMEFTPFLPLGGNAVFFVDPYLRTPYVYQYNLTLQRELAVNLAVEIAYVGSSSHKLTGQIDMNPFVPETGRRVLNTETEYFSFLSAFANVGSGNYNSMQLSLEKRSGSTKFLGTSAFKLSYTYGHSLDTTSGFAEKNIGQVPSYNPRLFYASGDEDIRHSLAVSGRWELPFDHLWNKGSKRLMQGWVLYPIIRYRSGFPVDILAGFSNDPGDPGPSGAGDGSVVRANLVAPIKMFDPKKEGCYWFDPGSLDGNVTEGYGTLGRNKLRGPGRTNVDVSLSKDIPLFQDKAVLQFRAEAFNIFNSVQWKSPDENISSSGFGMITDTYDPRILQFALRLQF